MNKEINEIIQNRIEDIYQSGEYIYQAKELEEILNYITDLQQKIDKAIKWCECVVNCQTTAGDLPNGTHTDMGYCNDLAMPLLDILKGDEQ